MNLIKYESKYDQGLPRTRITLHNRTGMKLVPNLHAKVSNSDIDGGLVSSQSSSREKYNKKSSKTMNKTTHLIDRFKFQYNTETRAFENEATVYYERPIAPKFVKSSFYAKVLQIRLENGDYEKIEKRIQPYLDIDSILPKNSYMQMVFLLYNSYPLLIRKDPNLFDTFRRAAIVHHDRDVCEFRECALIITNFLCPDSYFRDWDPEEYRETYNPIPDMDVLYTLRIWGGRAPFNCVQFSMKNLERAERKLLGCDLVMYATSEPCAPEYIRSYAYSCKQKSLKRKHSC